MEEQEISLYQESGFILFLLVVFTFLAKAFFLCDLVSSLKGWCSLEEFWTLFNCHCLVAIVFQHPPGQIARKYSSCSTIFLDDSTVSQPNLKYTIKWWVYRFLLTWMLFLFLNLMANWLVVGSVRGKPLIMDNLFKKWFGS